MERCVTPHSPQETTNTHSRGGGPIPHVVWRGTIDAGHHGAAGRGADGMISLLPKIVFFFSLLPSLCFHYPKICIAQRQRKSERQRKRCRDSIDIYLFDFRCLYKCISRAYIYLRAFWSPRKKAPVCSGGVLGWAGRGVGSAEKGSSIATVNATTASHYTTAPP